MPSDCDTAFHFWKKKAMKKRIVSYKKLQTDRVVKKNFNCTSRILPNTEYNIEEFCARWAWASLISHVALSLSQECDLEWMLLQQILQSSSSMLQADHTVSSLFCPRKSQNDSILCTSFTSLLNLHSHILQDDYYSHLLTLGELLYFRLTVKFQWSHSPPQIYENSTNYCNHHLCTWLSIH